MVRLDYETPKVQSVPLRAVWRHYAVSSLVGITSACIAGDWAFFYAFRDTMLSPQPQWPATLFWGAGSIIFTGPLLKVALGQRGDVAVAQFRASILGLLGPWVMVALIFALTYFE